MLERMAKELVVFKNAMEEEVHIPRMLYWALLGVLFISIIDSLVDIFLV